MSASAMAASSAGHGNGGQLVDLDAIVTHHNQSGELFRIQSGELFRIEGHCQTNLARIPIGLNWDAL